MVETDRAEIVAEQKRVKDSIADLQTRIAAATGDAAYQLKVKAAEAAANLKGLIQQAAAKTLEKEVAKRAQELAAAEKKSKGIQSRRKKLRKELQSVQEEISDASAGKAKGLA
jgi:chaperonin cofactor prefoldin